MEVRPSCVMVSSSKCLRQMQNISAHAAILFVYSKKLESWGRKPMHGQYRRLTDEPLVDMKETYRWLKSSNLPAATEGLVAAAQDQARWTRYYESNTASRCQSHLQLVQSTPENS